MRDLISIIVPVYNTDKALIKKCIYSLINQTYKDLEIILVDDGSTNDSGKYCDTFTEIDKRIVVIHKNNGGLSSARNAGLERAKGDFISFVDSDDCLHLESIQRMLECYRKCNCDIICMQSIIINEKGDILYYFGNDTKLFKEINSLKYIQGICEKKLSESVCDKLFLRKILLNRKFEYGRLNEDFYFLSKLLLDGVRIAILDFAGYFYLKHSGTITSNTVDFRSLKDAIQNSLELLILSKKKNINADVFFAYSALFQTKVLLTILPIKKISRISEEFIFAQHIIYKLNSYIDRCGLKLVDVYYLKTMMVCPIFLRLLVDVIRYVKLKLIGKE